MMRRILSLVITLAILFSMVPVSTFAAQEGQQADSGTTQAGTLDGNSGILQSATPAVSATSTDNGWTWQVSGTVLTISGTGPMKDYSTTSTAPWGTSITKVVIQSGITSIGNYAFYGCTSLNSITIADTVQTIGRNAFSGCAALLDLIIPEGVLEIGMFAFENCTALTDVSIANSVKRMDQSVFYACTALNYTTYDNGLYLGNEQNPYMVLAATVGTTITSINIHAQTKLILSQAFNNCSRLSAVTIPESVIFIGVAAFNGCGTLTRVNISNLQAWMKINFASGTANPLNIAKKLYLNGTLVTNVVVPDGIEAIMPYVFYNCTSITAVQLPTGIKSIGDGAFSGCTALASVNIPNGVTQIGTEAFKNCKALTEMVIPQSVQTMGGAMFNGCSGLRALTIPFVGALVNNNSKTYQYPFGYIFGGTSYTGGTSTSQTYFDTSSYYASGAPVTTYGATYYIPTSLTSVTVTGGNIFYYAFSNCNKITNVVLEDGVTGIARGAFNNCKGLTQISIPNTVTTIGVQAFNECRALTQVTIPGSVEVINDQAFTYCVNLSKVTILEGVKSIGNSAFGLCTALSMLSLPDSLTHIGDSAFSNSTKLSSITVPIGVTSIGEYAFSGCSGATSISILGSVASMGDYAFRNCSGATSLTIGNAVEIIGNYAFDGCAGLTEVTIGASVTTIGNHAFSGCTKLAKIDIAEGVTSIGEYAFSGCSALTGIQIPESVTSIGASILSGCSNLQSLTVPFIGQQRKTANDTYQYPLGYFFGTSAYTGGVATIQYYHGSSASNTTSNTYYIPSALKTVEVLDGNLLYGAFYGCNNITHIILGDGVLHIVPEAFMNMGGLQSIEVNEANPNYCSEYRILYNKDKSQEICKPSQHAYLLTVNYLYVSGEEAFDAITQWKLATSQYSVSVPALLGYSTREEVVTGTMPAADVVINVIYYENEKLIGGQCTDTLSWTLYRDGMLIFRGTGAIPDYPSGTPWAEYAQQIEVVYLDPRVTRIGDHAFENCSNMIYIDYGYSVTSIGAYAFAGCAGLTSFKLPSSVTAIADGAFSGCTRLQAVVIPDQITTIGNNAFAGCSELVQVKISGSVTTIGDNAFGDCVKLTQVYFRGGPIAVGSNAFGSVSGKYIYYYSTVKGWDEAISNGLWNGYTAVPYNAIAKENFDGTNVYIIKVVDKHNTPLGNAEVNLGGNVKRTNSDGMVYYTKPAESQALTISCPNHITFSDSAFAASTTQVMDIIELSDKPSVVQGVRIDAKSIATSVVVLDCAKNENVAITVSGYSKYSIVRYELYQAERLISTVKTSATTATFNVNTNSFEEGQTVSVRMYTADGHMVASALNLDVIKMVTFNTDVFMEELNSIDLGFSIGELGASEHVLPVSIHGMEEIYVKVDGRSIYVSIGMNLHDLVDKKIDREKIYREIDDSIEDIVQSGAEQSVEGKAAGYIEIEYMSDGEVYIKSCYVKIGVALCMESETSFSWLGVVGAYFKLSIESEGGVSLRLSEIRPEGGIRFDEANIYLKGLFGLEAGAYLFWHAGTAGVYGQLEYGLTLGIIPMFEFKEVYIKGEIGLRWSAIWGVFKGEHVIASGDIYRWPEASATFMRRLARVQRDPNAYTYNDRGYLQNRSQWLTNGEYLQQNIYDNVAPKIVVCGDTTMMLWLDDNSQRSDTDFQTLYYSLYEDGTWSSPVAVNDNGTFDCEFDVCTYNGKIYLLYTEMDAQQRSIETLDIADQSTIDAFVNGVEVKVAVYENGAFGETVTLTDNAICELLPNIEVVDGVLIATWMESNAVGLNLETSENVICTAKLELSVWSAPSRVIGGQNIISDIVMVSLQGKAYTAYIVDADGMQETKEDQCLILRDEEGEQLQLDSGLITEVDSAVVGGSPALIWNNAGQLYMITGKEQTPVCLLPENVRQGSAFQIVSLPDEQNLMLFLSNHYDAEGNAEEGTDVYAVYIGAEGCLTSAIRLINSADYVANYAVSYENEQLVIVYTETIANIVGTNVETVTHFKKAEIAFYTDLIVDKVTYDVTQAQPSTEMQIDVALRNGGMNAIHGITANLRDDEGNLVYTVQQDVLLNSGASEVCQIVIILPQSIAKSAYQLEILPRNGMIVTEDANQEDNCAELMLAHADIRVEAEQKIIGEQNYIIMTVANGGNAASAATLQIYAEEKLIGELVTSVIVPGATEQYMVDINALVTSEDKVIRCIALEAFNDSCSLNDQDTVVLLHIQEEVFAVDPEQIIRNPELASNQAIFDKYAPENVTIQITAEAESFLRIEGLTEGLEYTVDRQGEVVLQSGYLVGLSNGTHTFQLLFDFDQPVVREFTVIVKDTTPTVITGTVNIDGDAVVGGTVFADLTQVTGQVNCHWTIDDITVGIGREYTVTPQDYGKQLILVVVGENGYTGTLTATTTIGLHQPQVPLQPVISKVECDSITVVSAAGLEYSLDQIIWQDANVFTGLLPNHDYTIYARVKATPTNMESTSSPGVRVTTLKRTLQAPAAPQVDSVTQSQVTLVADPAMEYMITGGDWTDNNVFTGLQANTTYVFYQRYKETDNSYASEASDGLTVKTLEIVVLERIGITTKPTKLTYLEGKEHLNVAGGVMTLYYSNETTQTIDLAVEMISGFDNTTVGAQTLTVTYDGKTTTFDVEIVAKSLRSIEITTMPDKLIYLEGDSFDKTGMVVTAYYDNDTSAVITDYVISGYTATPGSKTITVSYETVFTTFDVTVNPKTLTAIAVTTKPTKLTYLEGDSFDKTGMVVTAYYDNDTSAIITDYVISGYTATPGSKTITVTYENVTATFYVTVAAKTLTSIAVTTKPNKLTYLEGDSFDKTGMVVTAYYDNDTSAIITDYVISGYTATPGSKTITVTYENVTATFYVSVAAKTLMSIAVTTKPNKLTYLEGDSFDKTGMVVTAYYDNDTSAVITDYVISGYTATPGDKDIVVTYGDMTDTFQVTVTEKTVQHILVTTKPNKLTYLEGESFDKTGMVVTAYYNNQTFAVITDYTVSGYTSTPGSKTITVTYENVTATFYVSVAAKTLISIAVTTKPNKLTYLEGDSFDKTGMVVTAYYDNGTTAVITNYTIQADLSNAGEKTVTIVFGDHKTTLAVSVSARVPSSISSSSFTVSDGTLRKITAGTTADALLTGLNEGAYCKIFKGNEEVSRNTAVGTGMIVKIMDGSNVKASYNVVVTGDTNGDGKITITDMLAVKSHILKKTNLSGVYAQAGDTSKDGGISITDFIQIKASILGKGSIAPN